MKKLQRTIVLLTERPTDFQAEGFAAEAALKHFDSVSFSFAIATELPIDLDERTAKHIRGLKELHAPDGVYLIVHNKSENVPLST